MSNVILLHTVVVAKKVHLIHLLLILHLQFLLLGYKPKSKFFYLLFQLGILLFGLLMFGLCGLFLLSQLLNLNPNCLLLLLHHFQSLGSINGSLLSHGKIILYLFQLSTELLSVVHALGDESPHSFHNLQLLKEYNMLSHQVANSSYQVKDNIKNGQTKNKKLTF